MAHNNNVCQPGSEGPVTVSISRKVKPGCEADYEHWISGVIEAASSYPGHLGTSVLRPGPATRHEYVIIYRFDNYQHCQAWEQSELRQHWLQQLAGLTEGEPQTRRSTGLEFWFDLPELPSHRTPPPHKMALVLIVVVYLLIMGINLLFGAWLTLLPHWLQTLFVVSAQVLLLTFVVMPRVTKLLQPWLFKD
ncbi:MAG: antibiotic biosynthesis monooxygenase [Gammaproteobacteria bacterium]|nr:antibiotic biosynthesis monooxygenase [Pseudomaricurvus alcaniphilus]MBR9912770.1 antibiotic biosynthesis monooxygenase [Gammaproteobacteria bacterium]NHN37526.1 antibiotic biosynthesis monooxygenase [Pseudomaricurvus alcaniphilus]